MIKKEIFANYKNWIFEPTKTKVCCEGAESFRGNTIALGADALDATYNFSKKASVQYEKPDYNIIKQLTGTEVVPFSDSIGTHPDFKHLENTDNTENQYITSVFVDIKGSTSLLKRKNLSLAQVMTVKKRFMVTVIDIFTGFNAHIHRLQGDGVLAFFGHKKMSKSQSIVNALNATALTQFFFKEEVNAELKDMGLPEIELRIGIDFGYDEDVLWANYGIRNINEVTTTSMHTDLAAKLQNKAPVSGIYLGDNVKKHLDFPDEFLSVPINHGEKCEYIFKAYDYNYRMWNFQWEKYLNSFLYNPERTHSTFTLGKEVKFLCQYTHNDSNCVDKNLLSHIDVIPKKASLLFKITNLPPNFRNLEIEWRVENHGAEATKAKSLNYIMHDYENKKYCDQHTEYTGFHFMNLTIRYQGRILLNDKFGIYINND